MFPLFAGGDRPGKKSCGTTTALGNSEFACMQTFESETVTEKQVDFGILLHDDQLQTL